MEKKEKKETKYYASLPLPFTNLASQLKREDLDQLPNNKDPIERRHHVSVHVMLPHLPNEELTQKIAAIDPVKVSLDKLGCFENAQNDVLFMHVQQTESLQSLHKLLVTEYKQPWQHPSYTPHVTIAFLKPKRARGYVDSLQFKPIEFVVDKLEFRQHGGGDAKPFSIEFSKSWTAILHNTIHFFLYGLLRTRIDVYGDAE